MDAYTLPSYLEKVTCAVCGSFDAIPFYEVTYRESTLKKVICKRCSFVYNQIRPTAQELEGIYSHYLDYKNKITSVDDYIKQGRGTTSAPLKSAFSFFSSYLPSKPKVLEVGCSYGNLLAYIREQTNATVCGLEITPLSIQIARECNHIDIFEGFLSSFENQRNGEKFNLIILRHVLEHLHNVHEELQRILRLMEKDGILFIEVPNISAPEHASFERLIVEHQYEFSPWSLPLLLLRNGFKVIRLEVDERKRIKAIATPLANEKYDAIPFSEIKKWCGKRLQYRLVLYTIKRKCIKGTRAFLPPWVIKMIRGFVPKSLSRIR